MESEPKDALTGFWRIVWLDTTSAEQLRWESSGYFDFTEAAQCDFCFGDLHGVLQYRWSEAQKPRRLDFVWQQDNGEQPASGSGWAVVRGVKMAGAVMGQNGRWSRFLALRETDGIKEFSLEF